MTNAADVSVDVIIPTKDRPLLTLRAVRSVLAQTHSGLRVLLVDDGSTEENFDSMVKALPSDDRIVVIRSLVSGGGPAARQRGLDVATAEWIGLLDSDDEWLPNKLERQLDASSDAEVVLCGYRWLDDSGGVVKEVVPSASNPIEPASFNNHDAPLIQRRSLIRIGGFAGPNIPLVRYDDNTEFFLRLLSNTRIAVATEVLVICYNHRADRDSDDVSNHPETLIAVIDARGEELKKFPNSLSSLTSRVAVRYVHREQYREGLFWFRRSIRVGSGSRRLGTLLLFARALWSRVSH